jgi:hypothetical protein
LPHACSPKQHVDCHFPIKALTPLPSCPGNTTSADRRLPPPSRPDNSTGVIALVAMAPSTALHWCCRCLPVALVALVFVALASSSSALVWGASIIFSCLFGEKIFSSVQTIIWVWRTYF